MYQLRVCIDLKALKGTLGLQDLGELDREVLKKSFEGRDTSEIPSLHYHLSLSSWANQKLYEAGVCESPARDLCGCVSQTTTHLMCDCPALDDARRQGQELLGEVAFVDLPACLQRGLPPALALTCERTFWGQDPKSFSTGQAQMGCHASKGVIKELRDKLDSADRSDQPVVARNSVLNLKGPFGNETVSPPACFSSPPLEPNVFTDGGVLNPTSPAYSLGSFGIFWPNRVLLFNTLELDFAIAGEDVKGKYLRGPLDGQRCVAALVCSFFVWFCTLQATVAEIVAVRRAIAGLLHGRAGGMLRCGLGDVVGRESFCGLEGNQTRDRSQRIGGADPLVNFAQPQPFSTSKLVCLSLSRAEGGKGLRRAELSKI